MNPFKAIYKALATLFPNQLGMINERVISVVFFLEADKYSYEGNFTVDADMNTTSVGKLEEGQHFTEAARSLEVAKVYDDNLDGAEWVNFLDVDATEFSEAEVRQLRQIYGQAAELQFFYGEEDKKAPITTRTGRYYAKNAVMGGAGDYDQFTPNSSPVNLNGDFNNKVTLSIPETSATDTFTNAGYKLAVRLSRGGYDTTNVCSSHDTLYQLPNGCVVDDCNCDGSTTAQSSTFTPRMVRNTKKDLGFLVV